MLLRKEQPKSLIDTDMILCWFSKYGQNLEVTRLQNNTKKNDLVLSLVPISAPVHSLAPVMSSDGAAHYAKPPLKLLPDQASISATVLMACFRYSQ